MPGGLPLMLASRSHPADRGLGHGVATRHGDRRAESSEPRREPRDERGTPQRIPGRIERGDIECDERGTSSEPRREPRDERGTSQRIRGRIERGDIERGRNASERVARERIARGRIACGCIERGRNASERVACERIARGALTVATSCRPTVLDDGIGAA